MHDYSEEICMVCITLIAISAMYTLEASSSNIISAIGGGLIGYLKRNEKT